MEKTICKIILNDGSKGTGFFCKIPFINNNKLLVLLTNNHVINDLKKNFTIYYNNKYIEIKLENRKKYTNKIYDITIIEIKEEDKIEEYLEIDEMIMEEGSNTSYVNESIYLLQYLEEKLVSYGIIKNIMIDKKYNFHHFCITDYGASGSPIINIKNNKVIGIHKGAENEYNRGLFLNYPIKEFINKYNNNKNIIKELNEIFKLNLKDDDNLEIIDLSRKYFGNKGIEYLSKFYIPNLEKLDLSSNKISDIKVLEKVKFENLEKLDLYGNQISDIKVLEKVKFENLKELYLSGNQIDKNEYPVLIQNLNKRISKFYI